MSVDSPSILSQQSVYSWLTTGQQPGEHLLTERVLIDYTPGDIPGYLNQLFTDQLSTDISTDISTKAPTVNMIQKG